MRRHASAHDAPAQRLDRDEEGVFGVGRGRAGGQNEIGGLGAPREPAHGHLDGIGVVLHVGDVDDLRAESSSILARTEDSNVPRRSPGPILHHHSDASLREPGHRHDGLTAEAGDAGAGID